MHSGRVKWWKDEAGYGFIVPDRGGADIFVHHSSIQMSGRRSLTQGESVFFEVAAGRKGPEARNVLTVASQRRGAGQGVPVKQSVEMSDPKGVFSQLRERAVQLTKTAGRSGGICEPEEIRKVIIENRTRKVLFGILNVTEKFQREEVMLRYWPLQWQVTLKLDEDPDRWVGPPDGDETRGWAIWLRDDGVLLHGAWDGGWEPGAPKGVLHPRPLSDIHFAAATDCELEKMDIRYRMRDRNVRPLKRFYLWEETGYCAAGSGLADALTRLERGDASA